MKNTKLSLLMLMLFLMTFSQSSTAGCWLEKKCILGKCASTKLCNWESQSEDAPILDPIVDGLDYLINKTNDTLGFCADSHLDRISRLMDTSRIADNDILNIHEIASEKNIDYTGNKIYFINGILNDLSDAKESARKLSDVVTESPVSLIFNPSSLYNQGNTGTNNTALAIEGAGVLFSFGDIIPQDWVDITGYSFSLLINDIKETIYDRYWVNRFPNGCYQQYNPTTIKLTNVLYDHAINNDEGITVVSHSQGTIIARNAIRALKELGEANWVKNNLTWILAGSPLNQAERDDIKISDVKTLSFINPEDCIATLIKDGRGGTCDMSEHNFIEGYLHHLQRYKLILTRNDPTSEEINDNFFITKNNIDEDIHIITSYNQILALYFSIWNHYPSEKEISEIIKILQSGVSTIADINSRELNKRNSLLVVITSMLL